MDKNSQISFLVEAISDAQDIIKFIEAKTGIAITIVGAFTVVLFTNVSNIVKYYQYYSHWLFFSLVLFGIGFLACLILVTLIIKPGSNPRDNINFGGEPEPTLRFFLAPNQNTELFPLQGKKKHILSIDFKTYLHSVTNADEGKIIKSLTLELMKVSFIRNLKSDRLKVLIWVMLATTIIFIISFVIYNVQTENAIQIIDSIQLKSNSCEIHY